MPWTFEDAAPMIGTITEGNCWTGSHMLYSNIALNRIMRLDVGSGLVDVFAENTEGTNWPQLRCGRQPLRLRQHRAESRQI